MYNNVYVYVSGQRFTEDILASWKVRLQKDIANDR